MTHDDIVAYLQAVGEARARRQGRLAMLQILTVIVSIAVSGLTAIGTWVVLGLVFGGQ